MKTQGGCWKVIRLRIRVNGWLAWRAYWRPTEADRWQVVRDVFGRPVAYTERRFANQAAFEAWRDRETLASMGADR